MFGKILFSAFLLTYGAGTWALDQDSANVTVKGTLHEDKFGYFVRANGGTFDLILDDKVKADMHKFYSGLNGDHVQVSGALFVDEANGKTRLTVYANDVARFKVAVPPVVVTERREVVEPPPVIVREGYVEHRRHGIDLPGVHIHW